MTCIRIALGCCHSVTGVWRDADYPPHWQCKWFARKRAHSWVLESEEKGKLR
jgi:hypothetical protein